jgi:hypothetical protein
MYLFRSKFDWIIFIPRRVKTGLYVYFTIKLDRNESPRETKRRYSRSRKALYSVAWNKVPYVFIPIKV